MNSVIELMRPEIRELRPYQSAQFAAGLVRLNANETPWRPPHDATAGGLNLYPEPRPDLLRARLADYYGVAAERVLVTRGSSEAIDLLIRCFCAAGRDEIIVCPPTFGMYGVYAQVQGAAIREIPLNRDSGYALDLDAIAAQWSDATKLIFVCSPNNPTGNRISDDQLEGLAELTAGRGVVVLDGAYAEFADHDPTNDLLERFDNFVVLRTLSKAAGLAGIRCGVALAPAAVAELLNRVQPPYCFPTPSQETALACLTPEFRAEMNRRIAVIKSERQRLAATLAASAGVVQVLPSEANFLLAEVQDPAAFVAAATAGGVLVRDFSADKSMNNGIRITVGEPAQNDQLLAAIAPPGQNS